MANLVGVQSDCPAREKFGYGGDLNATSASFIYNFDMQSFYKKTVYDWVDAINDSTFVDTAPSVGIQYCGISWESAFLITQYQLYLYYNDLDFIIEMYPFNLQWMDKVARIHPEGIVHKGLSDHESLSPVPVELIGTLHYLQTARIMKVFAGIMEDRKSQSKYHQLACDLTKKIREAFWKKKHQRPHQSTNFICLPTLSQNHTRGRNSCSKRLPKKCATKSHRSAFDNGYFWNTLCIGSHFGIFVSSNYYKYSKQYRLSRLGLYG